MKELKHKIDVYFYVDDCVESQVWFYGTIGILFLCTVTVAISNFFSV